MTTLILFVACLFYSLELFTVRQNDEEVLKTEKVYTVQEAISPRSVLDREPKSHSYDSSPLDLSSLKEVR